jgi:outer membrane protein insertion porin family
MRSCCAVALWLSLLGIHGFAQEDPGRRVAVIQQVHFRGVRQISQDEIQRLTLSLQGARFEGTDWLHAASEKVRDFWQQHGYFRAQPAATSSELPGSTAEAASFDIVFTIDEGPQYRLGSIAFPSSSAVFTPQELRAQIPLADGDVLDSSKIIAGFDAIRAAYAQRGYATFKLDPNYGFDEKLHLLYMNVRLSEGNPYRLGKLEVNGPDPALAATLRSRFPLHPGDVYDSTQVDAFYRDNDLLLQGGCAGCTALKIDEKTGLVDVSIDLSQRLKSADR